MSTLTPRTITYIGNPLATEQITAYGNTWTGVAEQDVVINFADLMDLELWTEKQFDFSGTVYLGIVIANSDTTSAANEPLESLDNVSLPVKASATTAGPLTVKDPIPAHTASDSGKVLSVDSNGDTVWAAGGGAGGADWDATSGEPGYIENKPTPKVLTAGTNISISETASALTISATAAPQVQSDWTESDSSDVSYIQHKPVEKTLAAGSNVTIAEANDVVTISANDTTYTAGTGISISNNVVSEDRTVLFSTNTFAPGDTQQTYNLSESPLNFERIAVYVCRPVTPAPWMGYIEFYPAYLRNASRTEIGTMGSFNASGTIYLTTYTAINVLTTQWKDGASRQATIGGAWDSAYFSHIYRIVGINRVASN